MKSLKLACLVGIAVSISAQTPTQIDVSRVKGAAQLGSDGKVLASQLPASTGGGTGSGASQTSQLLDWKFTRVSSTRLQFGDSCLPGSPCNVDIGGVVLPFTGGPYTIDVSGSHSGAICVYVAPSNQLTVGIGNGLSAGDIAGSSGLTLVGGIDSCPQDAAKLAKWDVTSGAFAAAGVPYASYLSYKPSPLSGTGIQIVTGPRDTIQVDTTSVIRKFMVTGTPANVPGSTKGDIAYDTSATPPVMYQCRQAACAAIADWALIGAAAGGLSAGSTPSCAKHTVSIGSGTYTVDAGAAVAIPANVSTFDLDLFTMPAQTKMTGLTIKHSVPFTGVANQNAANGVVAGVGLTSPVTNRIAYSNGTLDVSSAVNSTNMLDIGGHYSPTLASHAVTVTLTASCSSGACSIAGLTAGSVDVWACTVTLP